MQPQASSSTVPTEGIASFSDDPAPPRPVLTTDAAVAQWHKTFGFRAFWAWIIHRCERIKGKGIMRGKSESSAVNAWLSLLDEMTRWIDEAPPHEQSNQRFGNLAFRDYSKITHKRIPDRIRQFPDIPSNLVGQVLPLLIDSTAFGHPTRLDYGTGHELGFVLALWCCVVSGWIEGEGEEDELILRVFPRYLELVTLLQKTYKLEPAGSHGVWGLDDYCFFPYLFGSAQLLGSSTTPSQALQRSTRTSESEITDLYTLSLHRIGMFKSGAAFSEHSPLLHQLSGFPNWTKPHGGLRKMFMGEVVGKRVVVQGVWVGGWVWGDDVPGGKGSADLEVADKAEREPEEGLKPSLEGDAVRGSSGQGGQGEGIGQGGSAGQVITPAPWARQGSTTIESRMRVLEATRGDWCGTIPPRR